MLKLGIIGCGAIGGQLARAAAKGAVPGLRLAAVCDRDAERARRLASGLKPRPRVLALEELAHGCDLLVEAAGIPAVPGAVAAALRARKHLLVMSVGALLDHPEWFARFRRIGRRLHHPSGAVAGLDGLRAAAVAGGVKRVELTTRKPPRGLAGAPFFQRRRLDPLTLTRPVTVFTGTARKAIRLFPQNINVAAAVSLAGIGPDRTRVSIIADPGARRNTHILTVEGDFGRLTAATENVPSPDNPKTSLLAGLSALALLAELACAGKGDQCRVKN